MGLLSCIMGSLDGLSLTRDWESYGREAFSMYGASVHGAGDIDQDGSDDVIIGAHLYGDFGGINTNQMKGPLIYTKGAQPD